MQYEIISVFHFYFTEAGIKHLLNFNNLPIMKSYLSIFTLIIVFIFSQSSSAQDQQWAVDALAASPRHQEEVKIKSGDKEITAFVVFPEVSENATVMLLIHENRGLNDWARYMADQVAEAGFIAVAPDLLSGKAPGGGNTPDFANSDEARKGIYQLDPDEVTYDLNSTYKYAQEIPAGNGKVAVGGFCWGGSQTFRYATNNETLKAAFVFYGSGPKTQEEYNRINTKVYGFYGGNDQRVNATIEASKEMMNNAGKDYEPIIYDGAGHGFMRSGQQPDAKEENERARDLAYERLVRILSEI